jgi:hypothetical protein
MLPWTALECAPDAIGMCTEGLVPDEWLRVRSLVHELRLALLCGYHAGARARQLRAFLSGAYRPRLGV